MKTLKWLSCIVVLLCAQQIRSSEILDSLSFQTLIFEMRLELENSKLEYENTIKNLDYQWIAINTVLQDPKSSDKEQLKAWMQKMQLQEKITRAERKLEIGLDKARYRKGLELIKLMYEKILGLDHHFYSLQTYQNVMQLSNPNTYPEFQHAKDLLENRLKKKNDIQLPNLLQSNPFLSASFSVLASFLGDGEPKQKEKDLEKIACILDFTVRMNGDLNTIFYETEFLKQGNVSLKESCDKLFRDYAKIIGYKISLEECRREDDWENVYENLELYIEDLDKLTNQDAASPNASRKYARGIANLEFSIDRLLDFLNAYTDFILQGEKYYQKFEVILSNYQNEEVCASQLPHHFTTMKRDIKYSIEKFKDAYFLGELKGSKLKDLLYGVVD